RHPGSRFASSTKLPSSSAAASPSTVYPWSLSCAAIHGATVAATLPGTARVADAGPLAPSSAGTEPAKRGKSAGIVSQMRPHAVSVWPVAAVPLDAVPLPGGGLEAVALDGVPLVAGAAMSVARGLDAPVPPGFPLPPEFPQPAT